MAFDNLRCLASPSSLPLFSKSVNCLQLIRWNQRSVEHVTFLLNLTITEPITFSCVFTYYSSFFRCRLRSRRDRRAHFMIHNHHIAIDYARIANLFKVANHIFILNLSIVLQKKWNFFQNTKWPILKGLLLKSQI